MAYGIGGATPLNYKRWGLPANIYGNAANVSERTKTVGRDGRAGGRPAGTNRAGSVGHTRRRVRGEAAIAATHREGEAMNRSTIAAVLLLAMSATYATTVHAEEWRWCAAADVKETGASNTFLVAHPFRADGEPDYQSQYEDYARSRLGPLQGEFSISCSQPAFSRAAAEEDRGNWLAIFDGLPLVAVDVDWSPGAGAGYAGPGRPAYDTSPYDATGRAGEHAYCMLQEPYGEQPRILLSQVFIPGELQGDYDARMGHRFLRYAQNVHDARPDATVTCHRNDTQAGAHDMRNHDAETRRIQGWTVVGTLWSD